MSEYKKVFDENCSLYYRILSDYLIKNGWKNLSIADYLKETTPYSSKESVLSKNYQKQGKYPIVSQSKDLISGYCDDESLINKIEKPIIIFGDHTQVVKYVDFDFVLGADGTKIITVTNDYVPKFFYYLIKSIDLHSNKYARHYSLLRKQFIPFKKDSLDIQNSIINYFEDLKNNTLKNKFYFSEKIERIILKLHKALLNINTINSEIESQKAYAKQLRQNILQDAIEGKLTAEWRKTHPVIKGNPDFDAEALFEEIQKEKKYCKPEKLQEPLFFEALSLPSTWEYPTLFEITKQITDGTHLTPNYVSNGEIFLSAQNVKPFKFIPEVHKYVSKEDFESYRNNRTPELNDILMARVGAGIGEAAVIDQPLEFAFYVSLCLIKTFKDLVIPKYITCVLNSAYGTNYSKNNISSTGASAGNYNLGHIRSLKIPLPPIKEQEEILNILSRLLNKVDELEQQITQREEYANQLMQSILKDAFEER